MRGIIPSQDEDHSGIDNPQVLKHRCDLYAKGGESGYVL